MDKNIKIQRQKPAAMARKVTSFLSMTALILTLYANFLPSSISAALAEETAPPACSINTARSERLQGAAKGEVANLIFNETPYYAGDLSFQDDAGTMLSLNAFRGKAVLVNLWATWCIPCRDEMPELGKLQSEAGDAVFEVVAVNLDTGSNDKARAFLRDSGADNLTLYRDTSMAIFQQVRRQGLAPGLPTTLLLDGQGCLVASFIGSAPWGGSDALAFITALKEEQANSGN